MKNLSLVFLLPLQISHISAVSIDRQTVHKQMQQGVKKKRGVHKSHRIVNNWKDAALPGMEIPLEQGCYGL